MSTERGRDDSARDDQGSVSALVVGLVMTFVACAGLGVDGGRLVSARMRVSDHAENAARVGAQAVTDLRLGIPVVDRTRAIRLAGDFLRSIGASGSIEASRLEVCVSVHESVPMSVLGLIGVGSKIVDGRRCAQPIMEM